MHVKRAMEGIARVGFLVASGQFIGETGQLSIESNRLNLGRALLASCTHGSPSIPFVSSSSNFAPRHADAARSKSKQGSCVLPANWHQRASMLCCCTVLYVLSVVVCMRGTTWSLNATCHYVCCIFESCRQKVLTVAAYVYESMVVCCILILVLVIPGFYERSTYMI